MDSLGKVTAQDLVDAVRPCLPLPGIDRVDVDWYADGTPFILAHGTTGGKVIEDQRIIGAIWQACAERGWSIHLDPQDEGGSVTIFYGHIMERASTTEYVTVRGTDAIALCRAYAAACEAGKGAT